MRNAARVPIRGRAAALRAAGLLVAVVVAGTPDLARHCQAQQAPQPPPWKRLELLRGGDLVVRLHFQESATLADARWLRFEFENRGPQPLEINSVSYMFNRETHDPESGELLASGGLGQGTAQELFPGEPGRAINIPPHGRESSEHVSNYAAALLGLPPARGHRVKVAAAVQIELKDGRRLERRLADGLEFQFLWRHPAAGEIAAMRRRLRQLLNYPNDQYATGYLIGAYLNVPDVAKSVSAKELVASLIPRADRPFSGCDSILRHLNDHHRDAPDLLAHVASQLRAGDAVFIRSQLHLLPDVWRTDFTDPLVAAFERHRDVRDTVLSHLRRHALVSEDNQKVARRLADVYYREGDIKRLREQQTDNPASLMKSLGMTRDRRLVAVLAPFLRDKRRLAVNMRAHRLHLGGPPKPERVCDAALEAILVILDGETRRPNSGFDPDRILPQRDAMLAQLEARLASLPEFADAVSPAPTVPLDEQTRALSARWKAEQKHDDLLRLKPVVKPGLNAEQVRQILGLPLEIERTEAGERWLYLKPKFRQGVSDFYWLRLNAGQQVIDWSVLAWNKKYQPQSAPPAAHRTARESERERPAELWDSVSYVGSLDEVVALRGAELFSISADGRAGKRLAQTDRLRDAKIVADQRAGDRVWLLCESPRQAPFALDLTSGECVDFAIEGLALPGERAPVIQSHVCTPFQTALLMVAGGDPANWPRPGNRPLYFWIDFRTGDSRRFPTGWDLDEFSPDQRTAIFSGAMERRALTAIDVADGQATTMKRGEDSSHVPFDWSNQDAAKPLLDPQDRLVGVSARGKAFPLQIVLDEPYLPSAKLLGERVAIHVRGYGSPRSESNLWLADLAPNGQPVHVSSGVRDFHLLDDKRCVFTMPVLDPMCGQVEAFVYDATRDSMWNVLDGVEGLRDGASRVELYASVGESAKRRVLVSMSCRPDSDFRESWRQWVLLDANGQRFLINDMPEEVTQHAQEKLWLLESGGLLFAVGEWVSVEGRDVIRYRVRRVAFES